MRRVLGDRVGDELERRGQPHVEVLADLGAQHPGRGLQRFAGRLALLGGAEHRVEHRRVLQVARDAHVGDRHETEARVAETLLETLREDDADAVAQACLTFAGH